MRLLNNTKKIILGLGALVLAGTLIVSCKKERDVLNTKGGDLYQPYLPLTIGKYITYEVDSSIWDDVKCIKYTHSYQHQYLVADTFRDAQNRLSYVINIYTRKNAGDNFVVNDVIYYTSGAEKLELVEKNIRFMRMINPVVEGKSWDGNSLMPTEDHDYDYLKNWNYTYQNVLKPFNNGVLDFDNTVTVNEVDSILNNPETMPTAYASLQQSKTVYAYGVGMIYHSYAYWTYDPIPGVQSCRKGIGVTLRAIDYN